MNKMSFEEWIEQHDQYGEFAESIEAMNVYSALSKERSVRAMIQNVEQGRPAIEACADLISLYCDDSDEFSLADEISQRAIDEMIQHFLEPYGYRPAGSVPVDRTCQKIGIRRGTAYRKVG